MNSESLLSLSLLVHCLISWNLFSIWPLALSRNHLFWNSLLNCCKNSLLKFDQVKILPLYCILCILYSIPPIGCIIQEIDTSMSFLNSSWHPEAKKSFYQSPSPVICYNIFTVPRYCRVPTILHYSKNLHVPLEVADYRDPLIASCGPWSKRPNCPCANLFVGLFPWLGLVLASLFAMPTLPSFHKLLFSSSFFFLLWMLIPYKEVVKVTVLHPIHLISWQKK